MEEIEIKSISCNNVLAPFLRNQYFYGKLLTVRDFENEQSYFIKKQRLINKHIHGEGVVCGLTVEDGNIKNTIKIKSGIALDCCGREIIAPDDEIIDLSGKGDGEYWVTISYNECGKEQVAAATEANSCEEECCFSRIEEGYKIEVFNEEPEVCDSIERDKVCELWSSVKQKDMEKMNWVRPEELFVKQYQGNCPSTENKPLILAKITINDKAMVAFSIDNALINEKGFDKKLVHTNPKLFELLKCAGEDEKETPVIINKISWPHSKEYSFDYLEENPLSIYFSEEIECFSTNQCQKNKFSSFPEVFKMEVIVANNSKTPMLSEYVMSGTLSTNDKTLKFKPDKNSIKFMEGIRELDMQVRITVNGNFIRGKKTKKPVYFGMYEFKDDGSTVPQGSDYSINSGGKFESWFYITANDIEFPDLAITPGSLTYESVKDHLLVHIENIGNADIKATTAQLTVASNVYEIVIDEIKQGESKIVTIGVTKHGLSNSENSAVLKLNIYNEPESNTENNNYQIYKQSPSNWQIARI